MGSVGSIAPSNRRRKPKERSARRKDAEGNRTAMFKSTSGALDSTATDITTYTWDNRNRMTGISHFADYAAYSSHAPDLAEARTYDSVPLPHNCGAAFLR